MGGKKKTAASSACSQQSHPSLFVAARDDIKNGRDLLVAARDLAAARANPGGLLEDICFSSELLQLFDGACVETGTSPFISGTTPPQPSGLGAPPGLGGHVVGTIIKPRTVFEMADGMVASPPWSSRLPGAPSSSSDLGRDYGELRLALETRWQGLCQEECRLRSQKEEILSRGGYPAKAGSHDMVTAMLSHIWRQLRLIDDMKFAVEDQLESLRQTAAELGNKP